MLDLSNELDSFAPAANNLYDGEPFGTYTLPPFDEVLNPSAENLARYILERVASRVGDDRVQVYKVRCFETPTSVATYQVE